MPHHRRRLRLLREDTLYHIRAARVGVAWTLVRSEGASSSKLHRSDSPTFMIGQKLSPSSPPAAAISMRCPSTVQGHVNAYAHLHTALRECSQRAQRPNSQEGPVQHPRSDAWAVRLAPFGCDSSVPSRLSVLVPTRFYDDDVIMLRMVKTIKRYSKIQCAVQSRVRGCYCPQSD